MKIKLYDDDLYFLKTEEQKCICLQCDRFLACKGPYDDCLERSIDHIHHEIIKHKKN